ncbi:NUDIX hydrolase [Fuchsiella alkaliacetigena]|uniref:NUDIX hydrolase n=1 Tax=Fuchsiella alkaliacetigena TaxID=957042 RepID=UPI00200A9D75|nr:NUDIX hydrolase [Fuchsiella alkaliacetigena]MCK8824754.1 NUDIX hydrolase [Fuchsiella alkaliacetigena]
MESELSEEIIASTEVYSGRIVKLREDQVRLPDGTSAEREIVEHSGGVTIVPYLEDTQEIILVRQFRSPLGKIMLELPAGLLEENETPRDCAQRELAEETGYQAKNWEKIGSFYTSPGFCDEEIHLYLAQRLKEYQQHTDEDEFIEIVKLSLNEAKEKLYTAELADAKTIIGLQYLFNYCSGG